MSKLCPECNIPLFETKKKYVCEDCSFKCLKEDEEIKTTVDISQDKKKILMEWMTENIPIFKNPDFVLEFTRIQHGFLYGNVQCGKTTSQQGIAFYNYHINNETTFIITMDRKDQKDQAIMSMKYMYGNDSYKNKKGWGFFKTKNNLGKCFSEDINPIYFDDVKKKDKEQFIKDCLTKKTKNIFFILANKQLEKLREIINKTENPVYHLVVDEVDILSKTDNCNAVIPIRQNIFEMIRQNAKSVWGVSATSFAELMNNSTIEMSSIYTLPVDKNYKGIMNFTRNSIEKPRTEKEMINAVKIYLEKIQEECKESVSLLKVSRFKKKHDFLMNHFYNYFKIIDVNSGTESSDWVFVTYNGNGIQVKCVFFESIKREKLQLTRRITGEKCEPQLKGDIFIWEEIQIGDFLELLRKLKEERDLPPYIAIFSGDLAERGINFQSNDYSQENRIHLSHMLYLPKNGDCTDYIQAMRLCGIYDDDIIPEITAPLDVLEDTVRAVKIQEIITKQGKYEYRTFAELMMRHHFDKNLETEKNLSKKSKKKLSYIKQDDSKDDNSQNEEDNEITYSEGISYRIISQNLHPTSKEYYNKMKNALIDNNLTNKWYEKLAFIRNYISESEIKATNINNTSWNWIRHSSVEAETSKGLFFKKDKNVMYIRYNP